MANFNLTNNRKNKLSMEKQTKAYREKSTAIPINIKHLDLKKITIHNEILHTFF